MQVGGSPTPYEKAYSVLKRMVGRNGASVDEDGLEAGWRQAKAEAMACLESFDERAALQVSPLTATDHIPLFEETLGLESDPTLSDQQRRNLITPKYTGTPEAWSYALSEWLQSIDPLISLRVQTWNHSGACQIGRWYEPFNPSVEDTYDKNGTRVATAWPNTSDMHRVLVDFNLGSGVLPNRDQLRKTEQVREHLNNVCPAWVDHQISYATEFILDEALLDATAFGT